MRILPPTFHSLSSNQYGSLFLQLSNISTNFNQQSIHYQPLFFGCQNDSKQNLNSTNFKSLNDKTSTYDYAKIGETLQYKVMTNQWSFYMYLSDMEDLEIQIMDNSIHLGFVRIPIGLRSSKEVMNPEFIQDQIFFIDREKYSVRDVKGNVMGQVKVKIWTEFDKKIHEQIKHIINFHEMVVFQGISPINSDAEIPRQLPPQLSILSSQISNQLHSQSISCSVSVSHHQERLLPQQQEEHSRMIEQDIDKMIMQMQSKPYDPRQYQDNIIQEPKFKEKQNKFSKTMQNFSIEKSQNEFGNSKQFLATEASMRRPPSYSNLSKTKSFTEKSLEKKNSLNNSQRIIKGENLVDKSQILRPWRENSHIDLSIHQLQFSLCNSIPHTVFTNFVQTCYSLRIYLNNNTEQNFICQGVKQGETVKFNQKLELKNVNDIQSVKFVIYNDYGKIQCEGVFDLSRLYENKKGIFIVSMSPVMGNVQRSMISVSENKIMEVSPLLRTLRIQAEVIEKLQLVQIFIKISNISIPFNLLRYKIPMSKQTINHIGPDHINIFPHNFSSQTPDKILLEFWRNEQNVGQSEISLKNIKNTNLATFNINIDPTYLYDGKKQIKNFLDGDRIVGDFNLSLCFGTITQMQSVLLANIEREKSIIKSKQNNERVRASYDDRLGVIVKNKHNTQNEVSIQVEIAEEQEERQSKNFLQKSATFPQPQFCNQSMISHASHASMNQQNQFMNDSFANFSATPKNNVETIPQIEIKQAKLQAVTQRICLETQQLLSPVVKQLEQIKELCKPHLLYNIIQVNILKQIFSKVGITNKSIDKIFKLVLFAKEGMISMNYLYDLCAGIQIQGHIQQKLIHDEMFIVGAMRTVYRNESERKNVLLENDMEFREMVEIFRKIGLKLTLNEFQTLHKFLSKYRTKTDCQNLKLAIISEIDNEIVQQIKEGFYQQDILKQIYGDESQSLNSSLNQSYFNGKRQNKVEQNIPLSLNFPKSSQSNNNQKDKIPNKNSEISENLKSQRTLSRQRSLSKSPKPNKLQRFSILIDGIENVKQSAICVFDELPKSTYFRIIIESPIFEEFTLKQSENTKQFQAASDLKDVDGRVDYVGDGKVLACAAFSLIKDLESLYPMKIKEGKFCGLLKIRFE